MFSFSRFKEISSLTLAMTYSNLVKCTFCELRQNTYFFSLPDPSRMQKASVSILTFMIIYLFAYFQCPI